MEIRKVKKSDLKNLAQLFDQYRVFYDKVSDLDKAEVFLKERIKNKESEIFVAQSFSGDLVGFIQLYPLFSSTQMKRLWLLNDLYVHPDFRGNGISKKLLEQAKDLCMQTNAAGFMLETSKTNLVANSLYEAMGFHLDTAHNYYTWENE
jgi:ribosomal protein S18 acetylase RimI-like enzyme